MILNSVDKIEFLTLQDNYIEMTAMDNNNIVLRARPIQDGEIRSSVIAEHGFSVLVRISVQDQSHSLLFDFGFSGDGAARNAETLGANLTDVEAVVLSHGHSDHTGGMAKLSALIGKTDIPLYVHPVAFESPRYLKYGPDNHAHFPKLTRDMIRNAGFSVQETQHPLPLLDNTILFLGEVPRRNDFEKGFPVAFRQEHGREVRDAIEDDTAIAISLKDKGLVILSGCSHAGIINTTRHAMEVTGIDKIHAIMGGFHLSGPLFEHLIGRTTEEIKKLHPAYIIPAHCTGRKAILEMERQMPDQFILNMSGTKLTFT